MPRIFISHSHRDNELVRDLAQRLRNAGLDPVVDFADVPFGADWKKTVLEQIRDAAAMLVLVTPAALRSGGILTELGMAEGLDRLIVPITVSLSPDDLPAPLRTYHVTPFDEVDGAVSALAKNVTAPASN